MIESKEVCTKIVIAINQILTQKSPILVALDGGSGAGMHWHLYSPIKLQDGIHLIGIDKPSCV